MEPQPVVYTSCGEATERVLHLLNHLPAGKALNQADRVEALGDLTRPPH